MAPKKPIKMRGHHLLIMDIAMRKGHDYHVLKKATEQYGYGPKYMEWHFGPSLKNLLENPDTKIELSEEFGKFCEGCAKKEKGLCSSELGISNFDRDVIKKIGKNVGDVMTVRELLPLIKGLGAEEEKRIKQALKK